MKFKHFGITIMAMLVMLFNSTTLFAAEIESNVSSNKTEVHAQKQEELILNLSLDNFKEINKGINAYKAELEYDKGVFHDIDISDIICSNKWVNLKYNKENNQFVAINKAGIKNPEEVAQIKLKVKKDAKAGDTVIKIKELTASEGKKDILSKDSSTVIKVVQNNGSIIDNNKPNTDKPSDNNKPNIDKNTNVNNDKNNKPTVNKDSKIPNTGVKHIKIAILIALEILLIGAIIYFVIRKKINNKINPKYQKIIGSFIIVIVAAQITGSVYAAVSDFSKKGDVNNDNSIEYTDIGLIQDHLIDLNNIPKENLENADINNDEKITVSDLTLLVKKVENSLDFDVSINSSKLQNYYPNKNEKLELNFDAVVSYDAVIEKATINGKEYDVQRDIDTNTYKVKVESIDVAGIKEFKFTDVTLENNKKVKVNFVQKVDVLKNIPILEDYNIEEDIKNHKATITFNIKDSDNAFKSGMYSILDEKSSVIKESSISVGKNTIEFNFEENKKYSFQVFCGYDLDTNELNDITGEQNAKPRENIFEKSVQIVSDYGLEITELKAEKQEAVYNKNEKISLVFKSTNKPNINIEKVVIGGEEFKVTKQGNLYKVELNPEKKEGIKEYSIQKVILENAKELQVTDKKVSVEILKDKPVVNNFTSKEDVDKNELNVNFVIKDDDKTFEKGEVVLLDENNKEISKVGFSTLDNKVKLKTNNSSKYLVKILLDYNLDAEGLKHENHYYKNKEEFKQEVIAQDKISVREVSVSKQYPNKGETIEVEYTFETNRELQIQKLQINSVQYDVKKSEDGKYKVQIKVKDKAGILPINLEKVILSGEKEILQKNTKEIDVLKDAPTISGYIAEDNLSKSIVTVKFNLNDVDDAFISGKYELSEKQDINAKSISTGDIKKDSNTLELNVKPGKPYVLKLISTYDLDSNKNDEANKKENQVLATEEICMVEDYRLNVKDLKTYNGDNQGKYFAKKAPITVEFNSTNVTEYKPQKVVINGQQYEVTEKNQSVYRTNITGFDNSGLKDIKIESVILSNGKKLDVNTNNTVQVDILKDKPTVKDFAYKQLENGDYSISFNLVDKDNAVLQNKKLVLSEKQGQEKIEKNITDNQSQFTIKLDTTKKYDAKVIVDYDLDSDNQDSQNNFKNEALVNVEIDATNKLIELKDITSIETFMVNDNVISKVKEINTNTQLDVSKYFVKLNMKDMPSLYVKIKNIKTEDKQLKFVLDYKNGVQYENGTKRNDLEVLYGPIGENNVAKESNFETLLEAIKQNPQGTFELTSDIDASKYNNGNVLFIGEFKGTLKGNGHTINNLNKPLFNKLNGATVENIIIKNANIQGKSTVADEVIGRSTIKNVHVYGLNLSLRDNHCGGLVGTIKEKSTIDSCSVTKANISGQKWRAGGIVGSLYGSTIKNSYVEGNINNNTDQTGGIAGSAEENAIIENCIVKVNLKVSDGSGNNGGIVGFYAGSGVKFTNNVSLADGQENSAQKISSRFGNGSNNNYELKESKLVSNKGNNAVNEIEKDAINKKFFKDSAQFDETIWDLENTSYDKLPSLKNSDPNLASNKEKNPSDERLYIPNYSMLKKLDYFKQDHEIAYHNMYKLMPFYDSKRLVEEGNKIAKDHELNTQIIETIIPMDENGKFVVGLTDKDQNRIHKLRVLFAENVIKEYQVSYKNVINNIACYTIPDLKIEYNYNKYLVKEDSKIVKDLVSKISGYTFANNIDKVTPEADNRLFVENFDNIIVKGNRPREFVVNLLANIPEYNVAIDNSTLSDTVLNEITKDNKLEKILAAYNYTDRFYSIDIGGVNVRDTVFFDDSLFNSGINPLTMTDLYEKSYDKDPNKLKRDISKTSRYYNDNIKRFVGNKPLGGFIDYYVSKFTDYKDPNEWFKDNFKGILVEKPAPDFKEQLDYRAWTLLKKREHTILAVLTFPSDQMYMFSIPTTVAMGSVNVYVDKDQKYTDEKKESLKTEIDKYTDVLAGFYNAGAKILPDYQSLMNRRTNIHYDSPRMWGNQVQYNNTSEDPFTKHVQAVIGGAAGNKQSAAFANGTDVYWAVNKQIANTGTFTHESAHCQTVEMWMGNKGYRYGTEGESFTDSVLAQRFYDGSMHHNMMFNFDYTSEVSANLTQERIDSIDKLNDFYKKMWETINTLDYIESKAFLELDPKIQSQIAKKYVVKPGDHKQQAFDMQKLSEQDFKDMKLKDIGDLWDNHIMLKIKDNLNNGDTIDNVYWYHPHNYKKGIPSERVYKRVAFEMLSVAGYVDGWQAYMSGLNGKYNNDVDAIRDITKDPNMTWRKYQLEKYNKIENLVNTSKYFDYRELVEMFKQTMIADADQIRNDDLINSTNLRRFVYHYLQRTTKDFRTSIYDQENYNKVQTISNEQEFINKIKADPHGRYILEANIDLSQVPTNDKNILDVDFVGEINGNNKTISGITKPIFKFMKYSRVYNLKLDDVNITITNNEDKEVGALAKRISYCNLENVHVVKGNINAPSRVGGIAGYADASMITKSSSNIQIKATANAIGGFIGEFEDSTVIDCYSLGVVDSTGQDIGGFTGYISNTLIKNSYSAVKVKATQKNVSGGFVGQVFGYTDPWTHLYKPRIVGCISLGSTINGYKFDGRSQDRFFNEKGFENNYEFEGAKGTSNLNRPNIQFAGKIDVVTSEQIKNKDFYVTKLKWDDKVWNFDGVTNGKLPKLRNLDPNDSQNLVKVNQVNTLQDFLKIKEDPDEIYELNADIDFSTVNIGENDFIGPRKFVGEIRGNGHKLTNINRRMFDEIEGATIKDLCIQNVTISYNNKSYAAIFGYASKNSKISNISIKNAKITTLADGGSGLLVGKVMENSIIENISVVESEMNVVQKSGMIAGISKDSTIRNCFVQGKFGHDTFTVVNLNGGIVGVSEGNSKIENCYSKIVMKSERERNAGIIGESSTGDTIKNNVSVSTKVDNKNGKKVIGFKNANTTFENNYELDTSNLGSNNSEGAKQVTDAQLKTEQFYIENLKWSKDIWDLTNVSKNGYPTLKNNIKK